MDLSYDDTMIDLVETLSGGLLGAAITLLRHPSPAAPDPWPAD